MKPVSPLDLLRKVRAVLDRKRRGAAWPKKGRTAMKKDGSLSPAADIV